ncbi:hypothetical protein Pmani_031205 [Petrolisthes manimaculis]|uniref:Uncharacterized protein n=1 Tax=Petrolisthes manimaculis TaxID=1843537 RepID=A0AAE1NU48_9EUCA|nr:hypothetical protein Pmani_031205 [Petrolisthes manimaculis]
MEAWIEERLAEWKRMRDEGGEAEMESSWDRMKGGGRRDEKVMERVWRISVEGSVRVTGVSTVLGNV